jgi:hypothetical protein
MNVTEWDEDLGVGSLLVFAPVIIAVFSFTMITLWTIVSKAFGKTPVNPVAWYD